MFIDDTTAGAARNVPMFVSQVIESLADRFFEDRYA